jgi:hypothetical protein
MSSTRRLSCLIVAAAMAGLVALVAGLGGAAPLAGAAGTSVTALAAADPQLFAIPEGAGTLTFDPAPTAGEPAGPCVITPPLFDPLPDACAPSYPSGTAVTVTAAADHAVPGARFVGWSDYRCPRRPQCTVTIADEQHLSAYFTPVTLTVEAGAFGPVQAPGTLCPLSPDEPFCNVRYPLGTTVTLRRDPAMAQTETCIGDVPCAWTGSCTGMLVTCVVKLRKDEYVRAGTEPSRNSPTPVRIPVTVKYTGRRGGRILLAPVADVGAQVCRRGTCTFPGYRRGDRILISARGSGRTRFVRWVGLGAGSPIRVSAGDYPGVTTATFK